MKKARSTPGTNSALLVTADSFRSERVDSVDAISTRQLEE